MSISNLQCPGRWNPVERWDIQQVLRSPLILESQKPDPHIGLLSTESTEEPPSGDGPPFSAPPPAAPPRPEQQREQQPPRNSQEKPLPDPPAAREHRSIATAADDAREDGDTDDDGRQQDTASDLSGKRPAPGQEGPSTPRRRQRRRYLTREAAGERAQDESGGSVFAADARDWVSPSSQRTSPTIRSQ